MPAIINGNTNTMNQALSGGKISYTYPSGIDFSPDSTTSKNLVKHILELARESANVMSARHSYWQNIDNTLNCYIRLDESEKKSLEKDDRKPVSIVFPHSYALLETTLSYLCSVFFKDPIFQYKGLDPDSMAGSSLLELIIQQHVKRNKIELALHTQFRDALAYGVGTVVPTWETKVGKKYKKVERGIFFKKEYVELEKTVLFEGNVLKNIDPYKYLPDPNVSASDIQRGEYFGWVDSVLMHDLKSMEAQGRLFNIKYLDRINNRQSSIIPKTSFLRERVDKTGNTGVSGTLNSRNQRTDIINMYVKLIPKDFNLSHVDVPEKWFFSIAADSIIIEARPAGLNHDLFPCAVAAPDFDGYSATPLSRIEVMNGLQTTLDWMFNSHITNVRKTIHDMFIVDPYLVNVNDISNPEAGRLIRLRQPGWGKGVENAIKQMPVSDVTRQHIQDASFIVGWMNKVSGVDDAGMGVLRQGGPERLSSAEYQGTRDGMVSRLDRLARTISAQSMYDLGMFFAYHTQQFMSKDTYVQFYGNNEEALKASYGSGGTVVSPLDLAIDYDVVIEDQTKQSSQLANWMEIFRTVSSSQELTTQLDSGRIFAHIAQMMGAKDINKFIRAQVQTQPDEMVQRQVEAGNMIPATNENISSLAGALL